MGAAMPIPEALVAVLTALKPIAQPRVVGGSVRDWLLGFPPKDFDVEVPGLTFEQLHRALAPFGSTDIVGRSFGVIKLRIDRIEYDFTLPRRESKTGAGHRGFAIEPEPFLSDAEAAARRDFTVNAIAYDPFSGNVIDPYSGESDLRAGILRHTSPAFGEDPLRVLRAFQLAARFNFTVAPETIALCRQISNTFAELPVERVWGEWAKWAEKSAYPARGLSVLAETGWLSHFPEVAKLLGTRQDPDWHPEGDVFVHTGHCLNALVRDEFWLAADTGERRVLSFAVLAHDFGKPDTTFFGERRGQMRWISPGHEAAGGPLAETFLTRIGAPHELIATVSPLVVNHLAHHQSNRIGYSDTAVRRLSLRLAPARIDQLCTVMRADHGGRPPLHSEETLARISELGDRARALELESQAARPIILGRHLIKEGLAPSPHFKAILAEAFEAQLDGVFSDESGGIEWLRTHLRERAHPLT